MPVQLKHYIMAIAFANNVVASQASQATADMIALAFFLLLRPGEYTGTKSDTTTFRMQDVQLFIGRKPPYRPAYCASRHHPDGHVHYPYLHLTEKQCPWGSHWPR